MSTLWRRLRAAWMTLTGTGAAASIAFALLVFASVLASLAIPRDSTGLRTAALRHMIAASPFDRAVVATIGLTDLSTSTSTSVGESPAAGIAEIGARLRSRLAAAGMPIASDPPAWSGLTSGYGPVTGAARAAGSGQPKFEVTYRTALARYSHLVAGRLPSGRTSSVVQAAVTTTTAARFGLRVGTRLAMGQAPLVITGIIRPVHQAADFWTEDPAVARPTLVQGTRPSLRTGPGGPIGAGGLQVAVSDLNASLMLDLERPGRAGPAHRGPGRRGADQHQRPGHLGAGDNSLGHGDGQLADSGHPHPVPHRADNAVAPLLGLLYVSLAVMGAVVVLLGAGLVAQRRAAEFTLMRARGAALHQLGWLVLRASALIAAVAGGGGGGAGHPGDPRRRQSAELVAGLAPRSR